MTQPEGRWRHNLRQLGSGCTGVREAAMLDVTAWTDLQVACCLVALDLDRR
jgi:hypothetical protein